MADDRSAPDLYATDFYAWTQAQAQALRAPGVRVSNAVDWERVAEEIEDLGSEQRHAVLSRLQQIIIHLHKLETSAALDPRAGWREEIRLQRLEIELRLTATLRNAALEELEGLHRKAARHAQKSLDDHERGAKIDAERRWTLEALLGENDDPLET